MAPWSWRVAVAAVLAAAAAGLVLGLLASDGSGDEPPNGSVAFEGRSPRAPVGDRVRVLVELQRPSLGERVAREGELDARVQHAHVRDLERESRALRGALIAKGVRIRDDVLYSRVWSGFAATVDTEDLPQMQIEGVRVEPVRRFYPAAVVVGPGKSGSSGLDSSMAVRSRFARAQVVPGSARSGSWGFQGRDFGQPARRCTPSPCSTRALTLPIRIFVGG